MWYDSKMGYKDKDKQRQYQRESCARRRGAFFVGRTCVRCGSGDRLELDHIDPAQKISHNVWSWSEARRNEEIAKCQVLCHHCHWEKTRDDMGWRLTHGTIAGYKNYGCRCTPCKAANAARVRDYRARARMDSTAA